ncbi:MAG: F0F1 ATP synthase subunit gamma [Planctomycetota bacterium]|nr:MAG: F0F1 ATP synthase subunit gamma [Planctomycetota bacterium]
MESIEALKRKISSAKELQSVVKTMKALAAVSIRQFEQAVESLGDYYRAVELGLLAVMMSGWQKSGAEESDESRHIGAILFGSDQGMCGQFNEEVAKFASAEFSKTRSGESDRRLIVVGARLAASLESRNFVIGELLDNPSSIAGVTDLVTELLMRVHAWQVDYDLETIILFHNRPTGSVTYEPTATVLLPIDRMFFTELGRKKWPNRSLPMFTIEREKLASSLISQYFFISLFRTLAESLAAENASRLASMQAAQRNIEDRIKELTTFYNQQRQLTITSELLDIVSGFEALAGGR